MGAVQFEEVEAAADGTPGGGRELLADVGELGSARPGLAARSVRDREAATSGQLPSSRGSSMPSHISFVEPLRPECPSWTPIAVPGAWACTKRMIRRQDSACRVLVEAGAAGCDAALGADTHHLGHHQARAAERPCAQVDEVEVAGDAVHGRVHVHR